MRSGCVTLGDDSGSRDEGTPLEERKPMNAADPIVCYNFFTDGSRRPVFEDTVGQYVIGDDGEPIRGLRYIPPEPDMPLVVEVLDR